MGSSFDNHGSSMNGGFPQRFPGGGMPLSSSLSGGMGPCMGSQGSMLSGGGFPGGGLTGGNGLGQGLSQSGNFPMGPGAGGMPFPSTGAFGGTSGFSAQQPPPWMF